MLSDWNVLEDRHVVIEDRRNTHRITRHAADLAQSGWIREATSIDHVFKSGAVGSGRALGWITINHCARIDLAAGKVRDHRADGCGGLNRSRRTGLSRCN